MCGKTQKNGDLTSKPAGKLKSGDSGFASKNLLSYYLVNAETFMIFPLSVFKLCANDSMCVYIYIYEYTHI